MNKNRTNKKSIIVFLKQIVIPVLFILFAVGCAFFHISDVDFGYHLRTAEIMVKEHIFPTENTFSYVVPGHPWVLLQAYGAIPWYFAYQWAGITGLLILKIIITLGILGGVYLTLRLFLSGQDIKLWLFMTVIILLIRPRLFERPFLFSALFFSWTQYFSYKAFYRRKPNWLIPIPFIFAVWVNVHAGVVYGFLLLAAFLGGSIVNRIVYKLNTEKDKPIIIEYLLCCIFSVVLSVVSLSLVNPAGWRVLLIPFNYFTDNFYNKMILEYFRPDLKSHLLFYLSLVFSVIMFVLKRKKFSYVSVFLFLGMAYMALNSSRIILFYALTIVSVWAVFFTGIEPRGLNLKKYLIKTKHFAALILILLWTGIFVFHILPSKTLRYGIGLNRIYYPVDIFNFIKTKKPQGRIFHELQHGGPILWYLYPEYKVYCDGRLEAYDKKFWKQKYFPVLMGKPGWEEQLAGYDVKMVLLYYGHEDALFLGHILQDREDWVPVIFDDNNILYLKADRSNAELVTKFGYKYLKPIGSYTGFITKENAIEVEQEALRAINSITNKADHRARVFLARALLIQEKYKQASEVYQALYTFNPKDDFIIRDLAYALFRLNKYNQAEQLYKILANRDRYQAYAWYMLSFTAVQTRDLAASLECAQKAFIAEPGNLKYQQRLNNLKKRLR